MIIYIGIGDNQPTLYLTLPAAKKKAGGDFVYKLDVSALTIERVDHTWD